MLLKKFKTRLHRHQSSFLSSYLLRRKAIAAALKVSIVVVVILVSAIAGILAYSTLRISNTTTTSTQGDNSASSQIASSSSISQLVSSSSSSSTTTTTATTNNSSSGVTSSSSPLSVKGTFFADGKYYVVYSDSNQTIVAYSSSGISPWTLANATLPADSQVWYDGQFVDAAYSQNSSIFLQQGTPLAGGDIRWSSSRAIYNLSSVQGSSNFTQLIPSQIRVDSQGNIWVAVAITSGMDNGTTYPVGGQFTNYTILKLIPTPSSFQMASGFPFQAGSADSNYTIGSLSIIPMQNGEVALVSCGMGSGGSSFVRQWNSSRGWGGSLPFPYPCGEALSASSWFYGEPVGSVISGQQTALGENSISLLYYSSYSSCPTCSYSNSSLIGINYDLSNARVSLSQLASLSTGSFVGAQVNGNYFWSNSGSASSTSSPNSIYYGNMSSIGGSLFQVSGSNAGICGMTGASSPSGYVMFLYSEALGNGSSCETGSSQYSVHFALEKVAQSLFHTLPEDSKLSSETVSELYPMIPYETSNLVNSDSGGLAWTGSANVLSSINITSVVANRNDIPISVTDYFQVLPQYSGNATIGYYQDGPWRLTAWNETTLWMCADYTNGTALASFNTQSGSLSSIYYEYGGGITSPDRISCGSSSIATDGLSTIYMTTVGGDLVEFNLNTHDFTRISVPVPQGYYSEDSIVAVRNSTSTTLYYEMNNQNIEWGIVQIQSSGTGYRFYPLPSDSPFLISDQNGNIWGSTGLRNTTTFELNLLTGNITYYETGTNSLGAVLTGQGFWLLAPGNGQIGEASFFSFATHSILKSDAVPGPSSPGEGFVDPSGNLWTFSESIFSQCGGSEECAGNQYLLVGIPGIQ